jgi:hypothetical protein
VLAAVIQPVALRSERWTQELVGPRRLWLAVGWVATALHEGAHAALALLFGHEVTRVKWFDFGAEDGALGQVDHQWDPKSFYQRVGRFFIGVAPVLLGVLVLALAARFLLGVYPSEARPVAHVVGPAPLAAAGRSLAAQLAASLHDVGRLVYALDLFRWRTWAFLYVAYIASTAMRLSASDLRSAGAGMVTIVSLLLLFNALTLWAGAFATTAALHAARALALCDTALVAALALQAAAGVGALALMRGAAWFRARDAALARG